MLHLLLTSIRFCVIIILGPNIPLVQYGQPANTPKQQLKVLQTIHAHTQYCQSGDSTLEAIKQGKHNITLHFTALHCTARNTNKLTLPSTTPTHPHTHTHDHHMTHIQHLLPFAA